VPTFEEAHVRPLPGGGKIRRRLRMPDEPGLPSIEDHERDPAGLEPRPERASADPVELREDSGNGGPDRERRAKERRRSRGAEEQEDHHEPLRSSAPLPLLSFDLHVPGTPDEAAGYAA